MPDITMLRIVSSELPCLPGVGGARELVAGVEHLVAEAVADVEQQQVLASASSSARIARRRAQGCFAGTITRKLSL